MTFPTNKPFPTNKQTGPRRGFVKTNSVQSQFQALTAERDNLRKAADAAVLKKKGQDNSIKALREHQSNLATQIRAAHENLGGETKKRALLEEEQRSKTTLLEQERNEINTLNHDLVEMKSTERKRKASFVKEMSSLNEDLQDTLRQQEEGMLRRLISVPTSKFLMDKIKAVEEEIPLSKEEREVLSVCILEAHEMLKEANSKIQKEVETKMELEEESRVLRAIAMKGGGTTEEGSKPLGDMELDELERLWEQNWDQEDSPMGHVGVQGTTADPVNMNLFYGDKMATHDNEENVPFDDKENVGSIVRDSDNNAVMMN